MTKESNTVAGGILHGIWRSDETIASSDERLKTNIKPLQKRLDAAALKLGVPAEPGHDDGNDKSNWILRQLRPVSYNYKKDPTGNNNQTRFGFIAQDLERVLPEVIRTTNSQHDNEGEPADRKAVVYQDLIAVLAQTSKNHQSIIEENNDKINAHKKKLEDLRDESSKVKEETDKLNGSKDDMQLRILTLENHLKLVTSQLTKAASAMSAIK